MRIVFLIGSYRRNGNTDQICDLIRTHLENIAAQHSVPIEIETIHLGQQHIEPCRGCRVCFDRGEEKCPVKDDILAIKSKMQVADGILVASPIYVDDVSGITKTWIDRLAHICHRPEFAGKSAFSVVTVGSTRFKHALDTINMALSCWGFHVAGQAGFKTGELMKPDEMQARYDEKAREVATNFFQALHTQAALKPSFMSLIIFKVMQMSRLNPGDDRDTIDYQYWKNQGWTNPRCTFFIPIKSNPVKVTLARLAGASIVKFFE